MYFYLFFLYISFGTFLGKALRRPINVGWNSVTKIWSQISYGNTALPLAPDLQQPSNPTHLRLTYGNTGLLFWPY